MMRGPFPRAHLRTESDPSAAAATGSTPSMTMGGIEAGVRGAAAGEGAGPRGGPPKPGGEQPIPCPRPSPRVSINRRVQIDRKGTARGSGRTWLVYQNWVV